MVGAAALAQHEVDRVTDRHHQGFPGETAMLVQLVAHTQRGAGHGHLLQA